MAGEGFSWDELRLVGAIADAESLAGAADALGINGSTVFRRLGQLEQRIGRPLFERHRSGYVPTPAGADMAELGRRMGAEVDALSRRLAGAAPEPAGEIRLTTNDALVASFLAPVLAAFRLRHPAITLDVVMSNDALNLARRDADVALRATNRPPETLVGRRLATVAWAVYGARAAGWTGGASDPPLGEANWIGLGGPLAGRDLERLGDLVGPVPKLVCKVDSVQPLSALVEAGIGIGAIPCFLADPRPGLVRLATPRGESATALWLLTHPDLRHAPRIRAFTDHLAAAFGAHRALLAGERPGIAAAS